MTPLRKPIKKLGKRSMKVGKIKYVFELISFIYIVLCCFIDLVVAIAPILFLPYAYTCWLFLHQIKNEPSTSKADRIKVKIEFVCCIGIALYFPVYYLTELRP